LIAVASESGILLGAGGRIAPVFEDAVAEKPTGWNFSLFLLLTVLLCLATPGKAQNQAPSGGRHIEGSTPEQDEMRAKLAREMAKKANLERQALLKADTDKLLKLSTELKDYVDKTNENVLSLEVLKKAEEIEKLARSVKEKMKGPN
jgi:hypothetical protein